MALLDNIQSPADVRALTLAQLPALADELRREILTTISDIGGHLSSNLGSVELTTALHYALNTPHDRIVWDVGHQTYAHKILTGRRTGFARIRKFGGLSGFPQRSESDYDTFGTAHASTSISAAFGMAVAAARTHTNRRVVAVIGDGALSGGMAFEALNNAGTHRDINLLVILNDNEMSISPAVGAVTNYLNRILASRFYRDIHESGQAVLANLPPMQRLARRAHEHMKGMVLPGTLFEEFGFNYVGPIDGHDTGALVGALETMSQARGPQFLHIVTVKGKGFARAERDPVLYHGVGNFKPQEGIAPMKVEAANTKPTYTEVFGKWLTCVARVDERIVGITPAMREGSGLVGFAREFPSRYFDVGIAEQHAVTFAAGLACDGMKPVVAIYSTFLQRAYDQLIHDIAIQNLPVVFAIDRGGFVGADGATHHGVFDLSYLRCVPNLTVMTPSNEDELWQMLNTAQAIASPVAVRYPRGQGAGVAVDEASCATIAIGRARLVRAGKRLALLCFGAPLAAGEAVAEALDATCVDMRFVKPLDTELLVQLARTHSHWVTIEENVVAGGAGSAVSEWVNANRLDNPPRILQIGAPDQFIEHGTPGEQRQIAGLDEDGIRRQVEAFIRGDAAGAKARTKTQVTKRKAKQLP